MVGSGWIEAAVHRSAALVSTVIVETAVVALEAHGLIRLAQLVGELHEARIELARSAVADERLRFARDLHDLLGLSLSAIAPRGELARRVVTTAAERGRRELAEISGIARRALTDVQRSATGTARTAASHSALVEEVESGL